MSGKKKVGRILVKLVSTVGTGVFYVASKNPKRTPSKMNVRFAPDALAPGCPPLSLPLVSRPHHPAPSPALVHEPRYIYL